MFPVSKPVVMRRLAGAMLAGALVVTATVAQACGPALEADARTGDVRSPADMVIAAAQFAAIETHARKGKWSQHRMIAHTDQRPGVRTAARMWHRGTSTL